MKRSVLLSTVAILVAGTTPAWANPSNTANGGADDQIAVAASLADNEAVAATENSTATSDDDLADLDNSLNDNHLFSGNTDNSDNSDNSVNDSYNDGSTNLGNADNGSTADNDLVDIDGDISVSVDTSDNSVSDSYNDSSDNSDNSTQTNAASGDAGASANNGSTSQVDNSVNLDARAGSGDGAGGAIATEGSTATVDNSYTDNSDNSVNDSYNDNSDNSIHDSYNDNSSTDSSTDMEFHGDLDFGSAAVAAGVLNASVANNEVEIKVDSSYNANNTISDGAFSDARGISQVAQQTGHNSMIQQNFSVQAEVNPMARP